MSKLYAILTTTLAAVLFTHAPAFASWQTVASETELVPEAENNELIFDGVRDSNGKYYIAWHYLNQKLFVYTYENGIWDKDNQDYKVNTNSYVSKIKLGHNGNDVYLAWTEGGTQEVNYKYQLYVKKKTAQGWELIGNSLNTASTSVNQLLMAIVGDTPYVAWTIGEYQTYVSFFNGTSWNMIGQNLNESNRMYKFDITGLDSNNVLVAWDQPFGSTYETACYVKKYNGSSWQSLGNEIYYDHNTFVSSPQIEMTGNGLPYILWQEFNGSIIERLFHVAEYSGDAWHRLDEGLYSLPYADNYFTSPMILVDGTNLLYASWIQGEGIGPGYASYPTLKHYFARRSASGWESLETEDMPGKGLYELPSVIIGCAGVSAIYRIKHLSGSISIAEYQSDSEAAGNGNGSNLTEEQIENEVLKPLGKKYLAFPNPASDRVEFVWDEDDVSKVIINIFNIHSERVAKIEENQPGKQVAWDAHDIASGVYVYQITLVSNGKSINLPPAKIAIK